MNVTDTCCQEIDSQISYSLTLFRISTLASSDNSTFVLSEKVERKLVDMGFFDVSCRDAVSDSGIKGMNLNLEDIYEYLDIASKDMETIFSRAQ